VTEIKIPAYGNDASVIDQERQMLYVTSWAYAEIEVIDLAQRKLVKRVRDAGVLPHMFSMDLDTANRKLYVPLGATAVNGSHGAALTVFDVPAFTRTRLYTGWAPVDLIQLKGETSFLVFNSEDAFAEVAPDGTYKVHALPVLYPRNVIDSGKGGYYLSYGPHQSYWPVVYIWAAKNGILEIECKRIETAGYEPLDFEFFDRRIARLAQGIATDAAGSLWALQNSWGKEKLFLTFFLNGIRVFGAEERVELPADIERETSPRLIEADGKANRLYVVKLGEKDEEAGKLFVINPQTRLCEKTIDTGLTPADLAVDENYIYVSNFDSNTVSRIDKKSWETKTLQTGKMPLKMALTDKGLFVINHNDNTLERLGENSKTYSIPYAGKPDQLFNHGGKLVIASHDSDALTISEFDPATEKFLVLHEKAYPYGEATFDTANSSFYTRGQFGDSIFDITKIKADEAGRLWVTDFLSGKLFIVKSR
jgi:YVTN family beta-propeller protein